MTIVVKPNETTAQAYQRVRNEKLAKLRNQPIELSNTVPALRYPPKVVGMVR